MRAAIHASLFTGSLKGRPEAILVFVHLLAHTDSCGNVRMVPEDLAADTGLSVFDVKLALAHLASPDTSSRRADFNGRRIVPLDDGRTFSYRVVNWHHYQASEDAVRRRRRKGDDANQPMLSLEGSPASEPEMPESRVLLAYLNEKSGRRFSPAPQVLQMIALRLREVKHDLAGAKQAIDRLVKMWGPDPVMRAYLRPATIFAKRKWIGYYDDRHVEVFVAIRPHEVQKELQVIEKTISVLKDKASYERLGHDDRKQLDDLMARKNELLKTLR